MRISHYLNMRSGLLCGGLLLGAATAVAAQTRPPIRGTIALQGTIQKVYAAANTVIVKTVDGVEHLVSLTKRTLVHGGTSTGPLHGLQEGSPVVVHYMAQGANVSALEIDDLGQDGLKVTEGIVTRVDRPRKQITITFANGSTEIFRLTDHAALDAGTDIVELTNGGTKATVYYSDEGGRKVAHFFKRAS